MEVNDTKRKSDLQDSNECVFPGTESTVKKEYFANSLLKLHLPIISNKTINYYLFCFISNSTVQP